MSTLEKQVVILESDCVCAGEDGPDYGECFGCYDDAKENLKYLVKAWADAQGKEFSEVRIDGTGMGWQRQSGYAHTDLDDIAHALALRGDFRIVFTLENGELTAIRSSHDEPTGAHFTFTPQNEMKEAECWSCGDEATHENYDRAVCCTCWGDCAKDCGLEQGECDTCDSAYDLGSRENRCGDCGNCSGCCTHK